MPNEPQNSESTEKPKKQKLDFNKVKKDYESLLRKTKFKITGPKRFKKQIDESLSSSSLLENYGILPSEDDVYLK